MIKNNATVSLDLKDNMSFESLQMQPENWPASKKMSLRPLCRSHSHPPGLSRKQYIFWYQMKAHIFLIANPKFQLQILCSFGDITKSVKLIGIPENNFLCIFIIASSPGVHTFFCLWRVNKKLPQGKISQNAFQRSRSIN